MLIYINLTSIRGVHLELFFSKFTFINIISYIVYIANLAKENGPTQHMI